MEGCPPFSFPGRSALGALLLLCLPLLSPPPFGAAAAAATDALYGQSEIVLEEETGLPDSSIMPPLSSPLPYDTPSLADPPAPSRPPESVQTEKPEDAYGPPLSVAPSAAAEPPSAEGEAGGSPGEPWGGPGAKTIPIISTSNRVVGELEIPPLDRSKRRLRGMKMLLISLFLFAHLLTHRRGSQASFEEKVALTFVLLGFLRILRSLFSPKPEYEFSLRVSADLGADKSEKGLKAHLDYNGWPKIQRSFAIKALKLSAVPLLLIPSFFLVSGLIATLGFAPAVGILLGAIFLHIGGLLALAAGAGGALAKLFHEL